MCDDCINWAGATNNKGYGHLWVKGVYTTAHRWAYTQVNGVIPVGMIVRHKCDNRLCINPKHLELGTYLQNMQDAKDRGRRVGRVGNTPRASRIVDIQAGLSDKEIASRHNTSTGAIWKLRKSLEVR